MKVSELRKRMKVRVVSKEGETKIPEMESLSFLDRFKPDWWKPLEQGYGYISSFNSTSVFLTHSINHRAEGYYLLSDIRPFEPEQLELFK